MLKLLIVKDTQIVIEMPYAR